MFGICYAGLVLASFLTQDEAERALAENTAKYAGTFGEASVEALVYCASCGEEAGLIPASMVDNYGCQRQGCQY